MHITDRMTSGAGAIRAEAGLLYREGKANICPSCGGEQWIVGRVTAQCGLCDMPVPLKGSAILSIVARDAAPAIVLRASRTA